MVVIYYGEALDNENAHLFKSNRLDILSGRFVREWTILWVLKSFWDILLGYNCGSYIVK